MTRSKTFHIALVGDSDIDRWPTSLFPTTIELNDGTTTSVPTTTVSSSSCNSSSSSSSSTIITTTSVHGLSGATLSEIIPLVQDVLHDYNPYTTTTTNTNTNTTNTNTTNCDILILVVCGGENDISKKGWTLDETAKSLQNMLSRIHEDIIIPMNPSTNDDDDNDDEDDLKKNKIHLIFLGPKLEPWLEYDEEVRKDYIRMSQRMEQICNDYCKDKDDDDDKTKKMKKRINIIFINCLVLFCGRSGQKPGALWGGLAIPEKHLFDYDELHLNHEGYKIWKHTIESCIKSIII